VSGYVTGSLREDAERLGHRGWVAGVFFADDAAEAARATEALEVKYWSYERGGGQSHPAKVGATIEWSLILSGRVVARLGDEHVELGAGDYALIHPGTPNDMVAEVLEDVTAITVKAPSDPSAKRPL
jgi:mannose-6-phosphate isomerase-like protein (cupin superfamily)